MNERIFGQRSGFKVTPVSIGAMRFPRDVNDAIALIRHAIDSGCRYIDTSRGYGESEWILGEALQDGYRDKVILSTKCAPWITKIQPDDAPTADCVRRRLEESMRRLRVDYLDFYQVWNIDSREHFEQATAKGGMVDGILKARDEGLIGHTGFTTHDSVDNLLSYMDHIDWCEVILFTYNLLNRRYAPAIAEAHKRGIGTIIMNPVGGGRLAQESPVLLDLAQRTGAETVPELAVRFLLSHSTIDTILCGMQKKQDVDDTIVAAEKGAFSTEQMTEINQFLNAIDEKKADYCTACRYCLPCPENIDIPAVMNAVFDHRAWGLEESAKQAYAKIQGPKADVCRKCGVCEQKCTQHLAIMDAMDYAVENLAE
ncbi:MAG: aldo/keto reductase [Kiritimatiellales bacterium]|nr:aldo/keto reductase [Kiritimatiellales bacterium]